jgi:hypothetical protein
VRLLRSLAAASLGTTLALSIACAAPAAPPAPPPARTTPLLLLDPRTECTLETPLTPGVPGSPGHLIPSVIHPTGASELATLMRLMLDDLDLRQRQFLGTAAGTRIPMYDVHRKMRCAWPTPGHERDPAYDALAQAYLAAVKSLDAAPDDRAAYDAVVSACRMCHDQKCRGPIGRIEKLRLTGTASAAH